VIFLSAQEPDLSYDFSFLLEVRSVSQSICAGGFFLFSAQNAVHGSSAAANFLLWTHLPRAFLHREVVCVCRSACIA
jgi:hypothetical protein